MRAIKSTPAVRKNNHSFSILSKVLSNLGIACRPLLLIWTPVDDRDFGDLANSPFYNG